MVNTNIKAKATVQLRLVDCEINGTMALLKGPENRKLKRGCYPMAKQYFFPDFEIAGYTN